MYSDLLCALNQVRRFKRGLGMLETILSDAYKSTDNAEADLTCYDTSFAEVIRRVEDLQQTTSDATDPSLFDTLQQLQSYDALLSQTNFNENFRSALDDLKILLDTVQLSEYHLLNPNAKLHIVRYGLPRFVHAVGSAHSPLDRLDTQYATVQEEQE